MVTVLENLTGSATFGKQHLSMARSWLKTTVSVSSPSLHSAFATLVQQLLKSFGWIFV